MINEQDPNELLGLGCDLKDRHRLEEAAEVFTKIIELDPKFCDAYFALGQVQIAAGQNVEAKETFLRLIKLDRTYPEAFSYHGHACFSLGEYAEAQYDFAIALSIDPKDSIAHFGYACLYFHRQDFQGAMTWIKTALKYEPEDETYLAFKKSICTALGIDPTESDLAIDVELEEQIPQSFKWNPAVYGMPN